MSIDQLWAAYEEAQAAEYAACDRFIAVASEENGAAWDAAHDAATAAFNAVMAARAAWVPETLEDMAARVMGELAREQRGRKITASGVIYRWNSISPNENAAAEITDAGRDVTADERPALSLTPLAKVELDATWLEDASRAAGLDFAWMG